jgi:hypothetical protein
MRIEREAWRKKRAISGFGTDIVKTVIQRWVFLSKKVYKERKVTSLGGEF